MKFLDFFGRKAVKLYFNDKINLMEAFPRVTAMLISTLETMGDELVADDAQGTHERLEAYLLLQLAQTAVGKTAIVAKKQRKAHERTPLFLFARHLPGLYAAAMISGQDDVASKLLKIMQDADESIPTTYLTAVVEKAQLRGPGSRAWKIMQREVAAAIDALTPKQEEPPEEEMKALADEIASVVKELIAKAEMEDARAEAPQDQAPSDQAPEAEEEIVEAAEPEGAAAETEETEETEEAVDPEEAAAEAADPESLLPPYPPGWWNLAGGGDPEADLPQACQEDCEDCEDSPLVCGHGRREAENGE